jgi:hypothetical protein
MRRSKFERFFILLPSFLQHPSTLITSIIAILLLFI